MAPEYRHYDVGGYVASEACQVVAPLGWQQNGTVRGCIYLSGWGGTGQAAVTAPYSDVPFALADAGIPVIAADMAGNQTWGNDTSTTRVGQLWTYAKSLGFKSDKVLFICGSMGGLVGLNWMRANPSLVAAGALIIPALNLADLHDNRGAALASLGIPGGATNIETAYGGAPGYASSVASHNPATNTSDLTTVPLRVWASTDDPICVYSVAQAFTTTLGLTLTSLGAVGHDGTGISTTQLVDFLGRYA